jgi:hypothetical protein
MTSSTSRRALLDIIEEKERELSRIRNAAENVIEEEKTKLQQQLAALESEMEHNFSVLRDREEKIRSLENEIRSLEAKRVQQLRELEENMQLEMSRRTLRIEDDLKQESNRRSEEFEQDLRKKLKLEFEERLQQSEKTLHSNYMNKLTKELESQERELRMMFEQNILHQKSGFDQAESEWLSKLRWKDQEIEEMTHKMDRSRIKREKELEKELETRYKIDIQRTIEQHDKKTNSIIEKLLEENKTLRHQCDVFEDDLMHLNKERQILDSKLHELLGILHSVELTYEEKAKHHEDEVRNLSQRVRELDDVVICKEREAKRAITSLHDELYQTKRKYKMEKSAQMRAINCLKRDLNASFVKQAKLEGEYRAKLQKALQSKSYLENELCSLTKDVTEMKEENQRVCHKLQIYETENKSLESINVQQKLSHEEEKKKMLETLESRSWEEKEKLRSKISRVIHERDEAVAEKDRLAAKRRNAIIQQEVSSNDEAEMLHGEIFQLTSELRKCRSMLNKLDSENKHLKDIIASMRKEMEQMTFDASAKDSNARTTSENGFNIEESLDELKKITAALLQQKKNVSSNQSKKTLDDKMKDLEAKFLALSDEFNAISSERDTLRSISSRLQSEVTRMKTGDMHETAFQNSGKGKSNSSGSDASVDGVNINDFAQTLWSHAMVQMPRQARKSSERSTRSQEQCLEKLKKEQRKKSSLSKTETKVRNWNDKDD